MPNFDGTGPSGKGPMTGNGKGFCILAGYGKKPDKMKGYIDVQGKSYRKEITEQELIKETIPGSEIYLQEGGVIMPRGDGTGPGGMGPMTGRAAGYCAGYSVPGYANPAIGRGGFGRGRGGRGRGYRNMYWATGLPGWSRYNMGYPAWGGVTNPNIPSYTPEQEVETLKNQAAYLQEDLKAINQRIQELEKREADKQKPQK
jgi:hypothetical protein